MNFANRMKKSIMNSTVITAYYAWRHQMEKVQRLDEEKRESEAWKFVKGTNFRLSYQEWNWGGLDTDADHIQKGDVLIYSDERKDKGWRIKVRAPGNQAQNRWFLERTLQCLGETNSQQSFKRCARVAKKEIPSDMPDIYTPRK